VDSFTLAAEKHTAGILLWVWLIERVIFKANPRLTTWRWVSTDTLRSGKS
jgi:hypothetical protein